MTDAEIVRALAEKCMGWRIFHADTSRVSFQDQNGIAIAEYRPFSNGLFPCWSPLTSIADAFMVVEKMRNEWIKNKTPGQSSAFGIADFIRFFEALRCESNAELSWPYAFLYVTPRAISLAAIAALEGK